MYFRKSCLAYARCSAKQQELLQYESTSFDKLYYLFELGNNLWASFNVNNFACFFYPVRSYRISAIGVAPTLVINWAAILSEMGLTRFCQWLNFLNFIFILYLLSLTRFGHNFFYWLFAKNHLFVLWVNQWSLIGENIFLFCSFHQLPFLWSLKGSLSW